MFDGKKIRSLLAIFIVSVMMFAAVSCEKIAEYDEDSVINVLEEKLDIPEEDIYVSEGEYSEFSGTYITARYNDARVIAMIFEDEEAANETFSEAYSSFEEGFDPSGQFNGDYKCQSETDHGYIVVNGENIGRNIFGDRFMTGEIYAGFYYSGSTIIVIMPEGEEAAEDVDAAIRAFGFPSL